MKLETAEKLINKLMSKIWIINNKEYNLIDLGWTFKGFDRGVRRLGVCSYNKFSKKGYIGLSKKMSEARTEQEVEQTILHEIAHALDFQIRGVSGHDSVWKSISRTIGYKGEAKTAVSNEVKVSTYKYVAYCSEHGILGGWTRKPKAGKICAKCRENVLILEATDPRVKNLMK